MTKIKTKKDYLEMKKRLNRDTTIVKLLCVHSKAIAYGLIYDADTLTKEQYKYFSVVLDNVNFTIEYLVKLVWGYKDDINAYENR